MADETSRRLRTQAERDADGTALLLRQLIGVRTADGRVHAPQDVELFYLPDAMTEDQAEAIKARFLASVGQPPTVLPPDPDIWITTESSRPPRRRWWHRYTRRAL